MTIDANRLHNAGMRQYQLLGIDDGVQGIRQTLALMRRLARAGEMSPVVRELAVSLTNGLRQDDWTSEIRALFEYVRDQVRYVQDMAHAETLQPPGDTLAIGAGDCDDKSILLAALLGAINHPARFVAVAFTPENFEHVYVETRIGNKWVPLETTQQVAMGWQPPDIVSKMVYDA